MQKEQLQNTRHSLAHLLASAVEKIYPKALRTIGPATDNGFYYDFDFENVKVSDDDLKAIQKEMKKQLKSFKSFDKEMKSKEDALTFYADNPYKKELIEEFTKDGQEVSFYTSGNFTDLCKGGHSENLSSLDADSFKLEKVAGAYWRGDEKNKMLTRIYGLAFENKEALDAYILACEQALKNDHRTLGEKLDLFHFDESIGKGLPLWLPKGNIIKEEIETWAKETEKQWDYQRVTTPIITKENLFFTSGHLPLYADSMYQPTAIEDEKYYIKPMNCPMHHKVFAARPKSYRDLPIRLAEYGWCHRYEDSGSLFGLMRVRGMQMNDAHIYTTRETAVEEFIKVIKLHEYYYQALGIKNYSMELALRDPKKLDKYHGEEQDWLDAEEMTKEAMEKSGVPYTIANEGAAFYGPKMDFQIMSATGRSFTASTNQLDLYMAKRFELQYTDKDGSKKHPVIIHRAPMGTHERFIGFLIEHFGGNFPLWLSPVQLRILTISDKFTEHGQNLLEEIKTLLPNIRIELDTRGESIGKKIKESVNEKIPYTIILGAQEVESKNYSLRKRDGAESEKVSAEKITELLKEEINNKKIS